MFNLRVPQGSDVQVEVRLGLRSGPTFTAWEGSPDATDNDVINDMLANRSTLSYLWHAVDKSRLTIDDMNYVQVPARIVAIQDKEITFDEKIRIGLTLPPRNADHNQPISNQALLKELIGVFVNSLTSTHKAQSEALEKLGSAMTSAIKDISLSTQSTTATAIKEIAVAHQHSMEKAHDALKAVVASSDKLSGLADKIFEDSRDKGAALVHESRKNAKVAQTVGEQCRDFKSVVDLGLSIKSITEDNGNGGKK